MNVVLPLIQTDVKEANAVEYLAEVIDLAMGGANVDQLRLPEGDPDGTQYQYARINGAAVLRVTDWDTLKQDLANFVFAPHLKKNTEDTEDNSASNAG